MRRLSLLLLCLPVACARRPAPAPVLPGPVASATTAAAPPPPPPAAPAPPEDPYLWLEEVQDPKALDWVRARNVVSEGELGQAPGFAALKQRLLAIYDSKEKIPSPKALGKYVYNFWRDEQNKRGLWRRTSLAEFKKPKPAWDTVLDLDQLAAAEKENWVWQRFTCLYPKYERCLLSLSRGGADARVVREFDAKAKRFVDGGFFLPEAKSQVSWKDLDTIYVGTDFGPGSLTESGYPRVVKEWRRGTPLAEARTLFEADPKDMGASGYREFYRGKTRDWVERRPTFFSEEVFLLVDGKLEKIDKPADAELGTWDEHLLLRLRSDWSVGGKTWPAGALLVIKLADFRAGKRDFTLLFEPKPNTSLDLWEGTRSAILVVELEDVKSRLYLHRPGKQGWTRQALEAPPVGSFTVQAYDADVSDDYWFWDSGFTTSTRLSIGHVDKKNRQPLKQNPTFFNAEGIEVEQRFATSRDGTRVPYFYMARRGLPRDGSVPTILYGYGGFEISLLPQYDSAAGAGWLERGGAYVVANIRGGGEYGPTWHKSALKANRQRAYDDFIGVAEDLIAQKLTSTPKLGIMGGSNGGLLMGVMLTQRPELFGAVVSAVPLLDMKRYHLLLAGASWMEEYGDPRKAEEWEPLSRFSPYQNVRAGVRYPRTLFTTSTRDDRVHPAHARKMVARLLEQGQDLLYYENIEGGHGGAANNEQRAFMQALAFTFFAKQLGL